MFGFQQFLDQDSELTQELVEEGKEHIKRERRRIQRMLESATRRRDYAARSYSGLGSTGSTVPPVHTSPPNLGNCNVLEVQV